MSAVGALLVLTALIGLGCWQWQRHQWKSAILAQLAASQNAPAIVPGSHVEPFSHIAVTGRFRHDRELLLGSEVRGAELGSQLVTPLERDGLPALLVVRGWVPRSLQGVERPEGLVSVSGWARPSDTAGSGVGPARHFLSFDIHAMATGTGLPAAPYGLVVIGEPPASPGVSPIPARDFPAPPNRHLEYALTWFALALAWAWIASAALWARHAKSRSQDASPIGD